MKKAESVEKEALEFLDNINAGLAAAAKQAVAELEEIELSRARASRAKFDWEAFTNFVRTKSVRVAAESRRVYLLGQTTEIVDACAKLFAAKNSAWPERREQIGDEIAAIVKAQALGKPSPNESQQLEKKLCALEAELESGDERFSAGSNLIEAFRAAGQTEIELHFRSLSSFVRETITDLAEAA